MKILICGYGRHGKDTVAEILGLPFESSSEFVSKTLVYPILKNKYGYTSVEECFTDRVNHRKEWYDIISLYTSDDRTRLAKDILSVADIYVGMRNKDEFETSKYLFDLVVWVDASERIPHQEGKESLTITEDMCDFTIKNNGTKEELIKKCQRIFNLK